MEKILSVIVPTYNMDKYLGKCLDSLIVRNELRCFLEVLVVNDGSKDSSLKIANEYSYKYPEVFKVINKENGNYGSCVNRGLTEAEGKYVKLLDADDSFNLKELEYYLELLKSLDVDLVITDFHSVSSAGSEVASSVKKIPSDKPLVINDYYKTPEFLYLQMHSITYKRDILIEMRYCQTEGVSYTDKEWAYLPLLWVKRFYYCPILLYNYLVGREGQTMDESVYRNSIGQLMTVCMSMINKYHDYNLANSNIEFLFYFKLSQLLKYIYRHILIVDNSLYERLVSFDLAFERIDAQLYERTNTIRVFDKIPFLLINYWRKRDKKNINYILRHSLYVLYMLSSKNKA